MQSVIDTDLQDVLTNKAIMNNQEERNLLGNGGKYVVEPRSEKEIAEVLRYANTHKKKVNVISGGTKRGYGGLRENADILLSLANYKGIVEHSVGDLTMTVKPGTTMKEISEQLGQHGQRIPLDAAWPERATIGGVVSANDSGPKRLCHGSARDHVIGLRVVYADGKVIRTGGKVVKNVAGYDMNKLFIGAMGTLGVISELTIKLRPVPKYESLLLLHFPNNHLDKIRQFSVDLLDSMMEPVSLELLNPALSERLCRQPSYTLAIAFEDRKEAVHYQENWVKDHVPEGVELAILPSEEANAWWDDFLQIGPNGYNDDPDNSKVKAALKIGSNNMDVIEVLETANALSEEHGVDIDAHGGLGHGISRTYVTGSAENVISFTRALRLKVESLNGYVVCTHIPFAYRRTIDVWGEKPPYFPLLEGIKKTNDPNDVLNSERFVGGL